MNAANKLKKIYITFAIHFTLCLYQSTLISDDKIKVKF